MPYIHHKPLAAIAATLLESAGVPAPNARVVAEHLVESNLVGHDSHGVMRLKQYCEAIDSGEVNPAAYPTSCRESVAGVVLDGQRGFGQVAAREGMLQAIERARLAGVSVVTLRNCYHSGRLGAYSLMAVEAGMIGVVMVNAGGGGQMVAPFGGMARRLATNPFAIAAPSAGEFHPVLDIATSMVPEGKVRNYHRRGDPTPPGWICDANGAPTVDTNDFYGQPAGAILPWGGSVGYKGFGLAFMIDVMAGALSGAGCCGPEATAPRDGVLLLAIDIEHFTDGERFRRQVSKLIDHIKSCPPAPGFKEVFAPGELEHGESIKRRVTGIEIDAATLQDMQELARLYGAPADLFDNVLGQPAPSVGATTD